jgi:hypothetical protein
MPTSTARCQHPQQDAKHPCTRPFFFLFFSAGFCTSCARIASYSRRRCSQHFACCQLLPGSSRVSWSADCIDCVLLKRACRTIAASESCTLRHLVPCSNTAHSKQQQPHYQLQQPWAANPQQQPPRACCNHWHHTAAAAAAAAAALGRAENAAGAGPSTCRH